MTFMAAEYGIITPLQPYILFFYFFACIYKFPGKPDRTVSQQTERRFPFCIYFNDHPTPVSSKSHEWEPAKDLIGFKT
jgi:hypothetical protein